jgi:hypothetical protein
MAVTLKSLVVRATHVVSAPIEEELVMADVERGKYYGLDEIATAIWNGLEHRILVSDLCLQLMNDYDVDEKICREEVISFLHELQSRGLVDVVD